jgi:hypothetical protein
MPGAVPIGGASSIRIHNPIEKNYPRKDGRDSKTENVERWVMRPFGRQKMPDMRARQAKDATKKSMMVQKRRASDEWINSSPWHSSGAQSVSILWSRGC